MEQSPDVALTTAQPSGLKALVLRTAVAVIAPVAALALALWALTSWLNSTELVLKYIKALAWPLVTVGLVIWLRDVIKQKVMGTKKISAGAVSAEFSVEERIAAGFIATEKVNSDLEEGPSPLLVAPYGIDSAESVGEPTLTQHKVTVDDSAGTTDSTRVAVQPDENAERHAARDREAKRRAAIEKAMRGSAEWGWTMARVVGFTRPPIPVIEWTEEGHPAIRYATTEPAPVSQAGATLVQESRMGGAFQPSLPYDVAMHARNIEAEIRKLLAQRDSKFGNIAQSMQLVSVGERLRQLRSRLREIDPNSALLDD